MIDPALDGWKPRTLPGFAGLVGPLWTRKEDDGWAYGLAGRGPSRQSGRHSCTAAWSARCSITR